MAFREKTFPVVSRYLPVKGLNENGHAVSFVSNGPNIYLRHEGVVLELLFLKDDLSYITFYFVYYNVFGILEIIDHF